MTDKLASLDLEILADRKFAAAVGYFVISFSQLEEEMNRAVWVLLNVSGDARGSIITTAMRDFSQRMLLVSKLTKARWAKGDRMRTDCSNIIRAVRYINDVRNDLAHGSFNYWDSLSETAMFLRSEAKGAEEVKHRPVHFTIDYLYEMISFTRNTTTAMLRFRINVRDGADHEMPSLDKRPPRPR